MRDDPPPSWPSGDGGMVRLVSEHDWAATPLGPRDGWPPALRTAVELTLASPLVGSLAVGPERVFLYNDAASPLYGDRHPRALGRPLAESWPDAWAEVGRFYERVFRGEAVHVPAQPLELDRPGGGQVFDAYLTPVRDADGTVIAAQMLGFEIGGRLRAEAALRDSDERLRAVLAAARMGYWTWDVGSSRLTSSDTMDELFGLLPGERWPEGRRGFALLHPDDRARHEGLVERSRLAGEGWESEFRIIRPRDGETVWLAERAEPSRDPVTGAPRITGLIWDITAPRRAAERQQVLLAELQHRVRNILGVTRSIVSRSADGERSTEEYVQHLQGRIGALARTQVVLTRSAGAGVDLEMMVRDELLAQTASAEQFTLGGTDVSLPPKAAEVLTLALHELATNATKYGAFSRASGHVDVAWEVEARDGGDWLLLRWTERGVPIVNAAPRREGFGSELLSRRIPYELKGRGSFELKPGGLSSTIEFPLEATSSMFQTDGGSHGRDG